jgi:hypothetical protein
MRKGLIALGIAVAIAWPVEVIVGTYGAFKLARTGYTIAMELSIGSYSDSDRQAELKKRLPLSEEDQGSFGAEFLRVAPR